MIAKPPIHPSVALHGGKGALLLRLQAMGHNVPPFIILEAPFFDALQSTKDPLDASTTIAAVQQLGPLPLPNASTNTRYAVRSSALVEDNVAHSFAGQFKTLLNVAEPELAAAIAEVYVSGYAASVAAYKAQRGVTATHQMAVIIQEMIPADSAGVGFGLHPLSGNPEIIVINAVAGLGESLVSGAATADSYECDRDGGISKQLAGAAPVLTDNQIGEVTKLIKDLGLALGAPQDIEFAYYGPQLYLLQSRPVTTAARSTASTKTIWDNSNIVESYPGLTLPLTFSFIEKMYDAVYRQFSMVLGVRKKIVEANSAVFASMLGLLNGRVYYNLNSWYAALALLPGYAINARFMEGMMGVKDAPPVPTPAGRKAGLPDYLDLLSAVVAILRNLIGARRGKAVFMQRFGEVYRQYQHKDFDKQSIPETWKDYNRFEQLMLAHWKAPLVNDFFAMIYFGVLKKLTAKYIPAHPELHNELVGASGDIVTTEPIRLLPELAAKMAAHPRLVSMARTDTSEALWQELQLPAYTDTRVAILKYLDTWGERCVAELKLETISYVQDPVRLIAILQSYLQGQIPATKGPRTGHRQAAQRILQDALQGQWLRRTIYQHVLRQARYFVSNRENLRYYRTRGFGLVRRMMLGIGAQAREAGYLDRTRDVFYLKLEELASLANRPCPLQPIVAKRIAQYQTYAAMPLAERVITEGPVPEYLVSDERLSSYGEQTTSLQGLPCSAGVVRAQVRKVHDASALTSLQGAIMATYATDPGYVVLFPSASGILTERGSLLSHAAIVSREMGIPCIVGITGLMERLQDGDELIMDGQTGIVKIIRVHEPA